MPTSRNTIYQTETVQAASLSKHRYFWRIFGAHTDPFSSPTIVPVYGLIGSDKAPTIKFQMNQFPIGIGAYDTISQTLNLHNVASEALYDYLQDGGVTVDYNLQVNTIWSLYTDLGSSGLSESSFVLNGVWVQVADIEHPITVSSSGIIQCDIQLSHIGTALLHALPVKAWGQRLIDHIPCLNGASTPEIDVERRLRFYLRMYQDSDALIYAASVQQYLPHKTPVLAQIQEMVFVKYLDCMNSLEELVNAFYGKIMRDATNNVCSFASTFDGDADDQASPYDFTTHYTWDLSTSGDIGRELGRGEKYWLPFIKDNFGSDADAIAGNLYPGVVGGRQPSGWCKEYSSVFDWIFDASEHGVTKAFYETDGVPGSSIMRIAWYKIGDNDNVVSSMPGINVYAPVTGTSDKESKIKIRRGANSIGGCDASPTLQIGKADVVAFRKSGTPQSARPFTFKAPLTTGPDLGGDHKFWVDIPTFAIANKDVYPEYGGTDFGGEPRFDRVILAHALSSWNHWFYLQPSDSTGDHSGPDWIDAAFPLMTCVHHHVEIDVGDLDGIDNADLAPVAMPTLRDKFGSEFREHDNTEYESWYAERFVTALQRTQQLSDLFQAAQLITDMFGNSRHTTMEFEVLGPSVYSTQKRASRFTIDPTFFLPTAPLVVMDTAMIISFESDLDKGKDKVTTWSPK